MVFFQNMHVYKTFKVVNCVQNLDAQVFNTLLFKKVLVLNEEILSSIYKKWLFEPNDAFFYDFPLIFHFFRRILKKV